MGHLEVRFLLVHKWYSFYTRYRFFRYRWCGILESVYRAIKYYNKKIDVGTMVVPKDLYYD